jgi:hypothetical protein
MKTEPPADAKCRDKFLVQSVAITGDKVFDNVQQIVWLPLIVETSVVRTDFVHSGIPSRELPFKRRRSA